MKKHLTYLATILVLSFLSSCKDKLPEAEVNDFALEGIWLTDPALSDDVNAFKYLVFEGTTLHFYGENEIGNREYRQNQFALVSNSGMTGIEVFVQGIPGTDSPEDWSYHLFYQFSDGGNTITIQGLAMTFVGTKVSDLPERDKWVTNVVLSDSEFTFSPSMANFFTIELAKNSITTNLTVLGTDGTDSYLIEINKLTGEVLNELNLGSSNFYSSLAYGGNCQNLLAKAEESVKIIDCSTANLISTLFLPDFNIIWAITSDENFIWSSVYQGSRLGNAIVKMDLTGNKIDESVLIANSPNSMAYGGDYLWLHMSGHIHQVDQTTMTTLVSYRLPINLVFWGNGLEYIDGDLLVVDNFNDIYRFTPE